MLLLNVTIAVLWMVWHHAFTLLDFFVGFGLGFLVIILVQSILRQGHYGRQVLHVGELISFCLVEMLRSNIALLRLVVQPEPAVRPAIVAIPLSIRSDAAIALLSYLVACMPGIYLLDIASDKQALYVHTIALSDVAVFRRTIKREFESRVAEVMESEEHKTHV